MSVIWAKPKVCHMPAKNALVRALLSRCQRKNPSRERVATAPKKGLRYKSSIEALVHRIHAS